MSKELTKEVCEGKHNGVVFYVCDLNIPDLNKKPLRKVAPTRVMAVSNGDLPKGKNVYYSLSHFRVMNKDGTISKKVISPVDNTGFRSRSGNMLYTYTTLPECEHNWFSLVGEYEVRLLQQIDLIKDQNKTKMVDIHRFYTARGHL